jgi:hypothetical protein
MPGDRCIGVAFLLVTFLYVGLQPSALRAGYAIRAAPAAQWPRKEKLFQTPFSTAVPDAVLPPPSLESYLPHPWGRTSGIHAHACAAKTKRFLASIYFCF